MDSRVDKLQEDLLRHLEAIESRVEEIRQQGNLLDPDQLMDQLHEDSASVRQAVNQLLLTQEIHPAQVADLNQVVHAAAGELLHMVGFPVVVQTRTDPAIGRLRMNSDLLRVLVLRALRICADYAGPGSTIMVSTQQDQDQAQDQAQAVLQVESIGSDSRKGTHLPLLPPDLRSTSLMEIVRGMGGSVELDQQEGGLQLTLRLAGKVRTA